MLSAKTRAQLQDVSDQHGLLELLQIEGPSFPSVIRIVNDTRDWDCFGYRFTALPFRIKLPNQVGRELPRAQIRIDNIGREIVPFIESLPLSDSIVMTIRLVSRATPSVIDYEFISPISNIKINQLSLTADMGPDDSMRRAIVQLRFDPTTAPGLFAG
jgi:hypothetical protein